MKRNHTTPKTQLQGYALYLKLAGDESYSRQGHLFVTRYQAEQYRFRHFPQAVAWRITGVRVDPRPGTDHYPALVLVAGPTRGDAA